MSAARALLVAGLLGLGAAACSSSNEAGTAVAVDVATLYGQNCARCHGPEGRGDTELKKTIPTIRDFGEPQFRLRGPEEVEAVIMTGRGQMPAFGQALSRPKIQHLAGYARRLGELAANGGKPGQAKPGEAKSDEAKSDEAKPGEAKPDEAKPAADPQAK